MTSTVVTAADPAALESERADAILALKRERVRVALEIRDFISSGDGPKDRAMYWQLRCELNNLDAKLRGLEANR